MVDVATRAGVQHFELAVRAPFRLDFTVWVLRRRPENRIDDWDGATYRRTVVMGGVPVAVAVRQDGTAQDPVLRVALTPARPVPARRARDEVGALLHRSLGLDVATGSFRAHVRDDPVIGPLAVRFRGVRAPRFPTMFECLVNAIACQQLTLQVGILLLGRLAARHGRRGPGAHGGHAFPEPADLAATCVTDLVALGFSHAKARAVLELAARIREREVDLEALAACDDDTAVARLRELRGVGRWSAEYALLRGLGRVRVFPGDDVGARNNLARRLGVDGPLDYPSVRALTGRWDPYAGLVYFHLLLERIEANGWLQPTTGGSGGRPTRRSR